MGIGGRLLLILILKYSFAFSTDEFMSCDRFYQSKRRARILDDIPCDMGSSNYCEIKGSSYPEASIWRFKEENRALMKRMYGDLESTSLYREMRSSKLSPGGPADHAHHPPPADIFSSLQYDIRVGSGFQKESKLIKKVIRKKIRNEARPVVLTRSTTASSTLPVASEQAPSESMTFSVPLNDITTTASSLLSEAPTPSTTLGTTPAQSTIPFDEDITETETQSSSAATFTYDALSTFAPLRTEEFTEEPSDVNFEGLTIPSTTAASSSTVPTKTTTRTTTTTSGSTTMDSDLETQEPLFLSTLKYPQKTDVESREDFNPDEILSEDEAIFFESPVEYDYSGPSENACPVKEEVLAPFWANNTRDQVLALLNLYPFEQYIHMETCKLENQQFMCNEGCRCEQQYRLHRLLAFDPTNECRGIFSDWFRFPSYCVCKCYKKKNGPDVGLGLVGGRLRRKPRGSSGNREIPRRKKK